MKELRSNPSVHTNPSGDVLDVSTDLFAKVGHLVDEGDFHRQKGVGGIFDQFRGTAAGEQHRGFVQKQRAINLSHYATSPVVIGADNDPVRMLKVLDCGTLAQEFRVGGYCEFHPQIGFGQDPFNFVSGSNRDSRLSDNDRIILQAGANFLSDGIDVGQVGMTVAAAAGSSDCDKDHGGPSDPFGQISGESQPPSLDVGAD